MTDIVKESVKLATCLAPITVSDSPVAFPVVNMPERVFQKGALILAPDTNDQTVYVADRIGVTADQTSTGGFPLIPGASLEIPVEDLGRWYHISVDANQFLNVIVS